MRLRALELEHFRSYRRLDLVVPPPGLRLSGPNASGKSSLLEAVMMLATTRSARGSTERETIGWGSGEEFGVPPFARVRGVVEDAHGETEIEIALEAPSRQGSALRKAIRVNGRSVRAIDAVGRLKAVLFAPEDVSLVSGSPSGRRRYLDLTISQISSGYLRALSRYTRVLEQRNSLLKRLQRERLAPGAPAVGEQLAFWDEELAAFGATVVGHRQVTLERLAALACDEFARLTGGDRLDLIYLPSLPIAVEPTIGPVEERFEWARAVAHREFVRAFAERRGEELRRGVSVVGPHRDDLAFAAAGVDLGSYGSRGQQRLAVLALKLAETRLMTEKAGEPPVLLLDDVLSELDAEHRTLLEDAAASVGTQLLVTGTDERAWTGSVLERLPGARVVDGRIDLEGEPRPA
jgi:DNA replication and repair protein RecF